MRTEQQRKELAAKLGGVFIGEGGAVGPLTNPEGVRMTVEADGTAYLNAVELAGYLRRAADMQTDVTAAKIFRMVADKVEECQDDVDRAAEELGLEPRPVDRRGLEPRS